MDSSKWLVIGPELGGLKGYEAVVTKGVDGHTLELTAPINQGKKLPIPANVFHELARHGGEGQVEFNLTRPGGPWWFVNRGLPSEG